MREQQMQDRMKLGAAVLSGYLLGRTKKGGLALRTAIWISGNPEVVTRARGAVSGVLASEEAAAIAEQLRGPVVDAIRKAALSAVLARVQGISDGLASRTQRLAQGTVESGVEAVDGVTDAASGLTGALRNGAIDHEKQPDTDEPDTQEDEGDDEHDEDQRAEPGEDSEQAESVSKTPRRSRRRSDG